MTVKLDGKTMFDYRLRDADRQHKLPTRMDLAAARNVRPARHPPMPDHSARPVSKTFASRSCLIELAEP